MGAPVGRALRRDELDAIAPLVLGEGDELLQLFQRAHRVAQLPAPIAPLHIGRVGEEARELIEVARRQALQMLRGN